MGSATSYCYTSLGWTLESSILPSTALELLMWWRPRSSLGWPTQGTRAPSGRKQADVSNAEGCPSLQGPLPILSSPSSSPEPLQGTEYHEAQNEMVVSSWPGVHSAQSKNSQNSVLIETTTFSKLVGISFLNARRLGSAQFSKAQSKPTSWVCTRIRHLHAPLSLKVSMPGVG